MGANEIQVIDSDHPGERWGWCGDEAFERICALVFSEARIERTEASKLQSLLLLRASSTMSERTIRLQNRLSQLGCIVFLVGLLFVFSVGLVNIGMWLAH